MKKYLKGSLREKKNQEYETFKITNIKLLLFDHAAFIHQEVAQQAVIYIKGLCEDIFLFGGVERDL